MNGEALTRSWRVGVSELRKDTRDNHNEEVPHGILGTAWQWLPAVCLDGGDDLALASQPKFSRRQLPDGENVSARRGPPNPP